MKKINLLILILISTMFFACLSDKNKQTEKLEKPTIEQTTPKTITTNAKFVMMVANTAGTSYIFKTTETDDLQVFPEENLKGMEFAYSLKPNSSEHEYYEKEFEIKYVKRPFKTLGNDIVDRYYLLEVKEKIALEPKLETFTWYYQMCSYTASYDANRYTEIQLQNTLQYLVRGSKMLKLFTIFNSDDLKRARERNVEKEYDKILKELNSKEFINTPFFDEIKQKRVEQVERIKALSLLELESYSNPSVLLKDPYTKNHCKEYVDALIASGNTLLEMREKMAKKSIENGNDLAWDRYLEDSKSPNKLELAQIYVTTLGWWNCVNKSIDYLDGYELHESGFLSLFQNITKECEEP